jgi:thiamine pyrophosphate-dependent acetolactate synthase large subunit-like protein
MTAESTKRMPLLAALEVLAAVRTDEVVVATMGAAREWPKLSQHELDLQYLPSAMGQAPGLGLGIALAQPGREVIMLNGDGGMLMNLGSLVTLAASGAKNLTLIVLENGLYEVTGGQATAGAGGVDFAAMARAAGFASAWSFDDLDEWRANVRRCLAALGPRFISLRVEPVGAAYALPAATPVAERMQRLRAVLTSG